MALIDCGQVKQIGTEQRLRLAEAILLVNESRPGALVRVSFRVLFNHFRLGVSFRVLFSLVFQNVFRWGKLGPKFMMASLRKQCRHSTHWPAGALQLPALRRWMETGGSPELVRVAQEKFADFGVTFLPGTKPEAPLGGKPGGRCGCGSGFFKKHPRCKNVHSASDAATLLETPSNTQSTVFSNVIENILRAAPNELRHPKDCAREQAAAALALLLFGDSDAPMPGGFSAAELSDGSPIKAIASFPQELVRAAAAGVPNRFTTDAVSCSPRALASCAEMMCDMFFLHLMGRTGCNET